MDPIALLQSRNRSQAPRAQYPSISEAYLCVRVCLLVPSFLLNRLLELVPERLSITKFRPLACDHKQSLFFEHLLCLSVYLSFSLRLWLCLCLSLFVCLWITIFLSLSLFLSRAQVRASARAPRFEGIPLAVFVAAARLWLLVDPLLVGNHFYKTLLAHKWLRSFVCLFT